MIVFSDQDFDWAIAQLSAVTFDWQEINRKFYDGDHWQNGDAWAGPRPPMNHPMYLDVMTEIERGLVSKNVVKEGTKRHTNGVFGSEPSWSLTLLRPLADGESPTNEEQALIDEAEAFLTDWWNERGLHQLFQQACTTSLLEQRSSLRIYVPSGLIVDGKVPAKSPLEAVHFIYVQHPSTKDATMITDPATMKQAGIYAYTVIEDDDSAEDLIEFVFEDGGLTHIRILMDTDDQSVESEVVVDLGKRLPMYEVNRDVLITPQFLSEQKLVNVAMTMMQRNVVQGGFLERTITNAQIPGHLEDDPDIPGQKRFIPDPYRTGPGTTQFLQGIPIRDESNRVTGWTTPGVQYRDPVPVDTFQQTKDEAYASALEEIQQSHVQMNDQATASGKSRQEARKEFEASLKDTKALFDPMGRWLIETTLALSASLGGSPNRYESLRAEFDAQLDTGVIGPEEEASIIALHDAGLRSTEDSMLLLGIDDPDAMKAKIAAEKEAAISIPGITDNTGLPAENGTGTEAA